jgi:Na+/alanine symporter
MSIAISWLIVGLVFFFGVAMDHDRWTRRDVFMAIPCLIGVVLLWPLGLANRVRYELQRRIERNKQRGDV